MQDFGTKTSAKMIVKQVPLKKYIMDAISEMHNGVCACAVITQNRLESRWII